jgi:hypothetical protein
MMNKNVSGLVYTITIAAFIVLADAAHARDYDSYGMPFFERLHRDLHASISINTKPYKSVHKFGVTYTYKEAVSGQNREAFEDDSAPVLNEGEDLKPDSSLVSAGGQQTNTIDTAKDQAKQQYKQETQAAKQLPGKAKRDAMVVAQLKYQRVMRALNGLKDLIKEKAAATAQNPGKPAIGTKIAEDIQEQLQRQQDRSNKK